ncbi:hypothetical protein C5F64_19800 [Photobacterium damselae subsp. damselae]|uniref:hypothetical protein n=1 Tax=Photobacterium damselae TaxID=38293 RepID=UPI000D06EA6C|nr:hypothetical protein [Photobacterium damselae]PSB79795.1 hypothetical protein C5F64_19800 [Photobacterium damselae subsp. damselae]
MVKPCSTSLQTLLVERLSQCPLGARCATQEPCGDIVFWNAAINDITQARKTSRTLLRAIKSHYQVNAICFETAHGQPLLASDWQDSVVTLAQFVGIQ